MARRNEKVKSILSAKSRPVPDYRIGNSFDFLIDNHLLECHD